MNGPIAQIAAMTSFANAALEGASADNYDLDNPTAAYCRRIMFIDRQKKAGIASFFGGKQRFRNKPIAQDFSHWISFLKQEKTRRLFLHCYPAGHKGLPESMRSGISLNGGRWLIEAWNGEYSDYWEANWRVTDKEASDERIWSVAFVRVSSIDLVRKDEHSGIAGIKDELQNALESCHTLSEPHNLDNWTTCFQKGLNFLETGNPDLINIDQSAFLPVEKYSEEVKKILFTTLASWVFDGRNSSSDKVYEEIFSRLYSVLCKALAHGINEYGT